MRPGVFMDRMVLTGILLILLRTLSPAQDDPYSRGTKNLIAGEYRQAVRAFTEAIGTRPDDPEVYNGRGYAYSRLKLYRDAIADYTKAIQLDPKNVKAYNRRGLVRSQLKEYHEAIKDYTRVLEMRPNSAGIWYFRALAKIFSGDKEGGYSDLKNAKRLGYQGADAAMQKYCSE